MAIVAFQLFIKLKPDHVEDFLRVARADATESAKESGNLRFEIFQQADDPTRLVVMEMYESDDALAYHRQQPYVDAWRAAVKDYTEEYTRLPLIPVEPHP
jgi:(4S)-4-hydroxy-5-phosphonooxypentane-2,3-dione isomerase